MSSLAPGLLVAAPPLGDANFDRSVVLLAAHGEEGAFGWIINGRDVMTLGELLKHVELESAPGFPEGNVRLGGPVGQEQVWLLYRTEEKIAELPDQFEVGAGITATPSQRVLEVLAQGHAPRSLIGIIGYAGWAPDQLEAEISRGAWLPADAEASLVFDTERDMVWHRAYEILGTSPIAFTAKNVGSA